jgi:hypothetical protein
MDNTEYKTVETAPKNVISPIRNFDAGDLYEEAENMLEEAKEVLSMSEKLCFINSINFA